MWKPIRHWELELWSSTSHCQNFSKLLFILINFTSPFPLAPYNLSLICTVLFQQYPQKTQQWLLNKPNGLFWSLYSPWLLGNISLLKIPPLTFFPLLFLVSLPWHFLKCFLQISGPKRWNSKEYLWAINFAKHCSLGRSIILITILKSLWSLIVKETCTTLVITWFPNFLDYRTHFIKIRKIHILFHHV